MKNLKEKINELNYFENKLIKYKMIYYKLKFIEYNEIFYKNKLKSIIKSIISLINIINYLLYFLLLYFNFFFTFSIIVNNHRSLFSNICHVVIFEES